VLTIAFVDAVWLMTATVAELVVQRGAAFHIYPLHNEPADTMARDRLDAALAEYKRRVGGM